MFGLAAVASTLPAWAGTAAATLLNIMAVDICSVSSCFGVKMVDCSGFLRCSRWCRCVESRRQIGE
jgi:hypothetical protein